MPAQRPNVVLVMTDDQGYPDLGCTGNPWLETPHIDAFHAEAVRLDDFHVQPLCTPTRGALMTGRRPVRNGAWATCWGRSILRRDEKTLADAFAAAGYRTGLFGKWHLGDNHPFRPFERGFTRTVAHHGGGVGQAPDFWGNNYFDDTYFHNGRARAHTGYCTDVWFEQGMRFIDEAPDEPFFAYISTNAPHSPYFVAEKYRRPYADNPDIPEPDFYGMIANIDENFGKLSRFLDERGLRENTILIFMTDNGSSGAAQLDETGHAARGYNAGMRGMKGSYYDGGHRVPFFIRWPGGGLTGGRDIGEMALDIDLLPTFMDLCGLPDPGCKPFDGTSIAPLLRGEVEALPERTHFLNILQSNEPPQKERGAVMTRRWRLVHGKELYDIKADPGQTRDVAADHPKVVQELQAALEAWWAEVSPTFDEVCAIVVGTDAENPAKLCSMDLMGDVVWNQGAIAAAHKAAGFWNVEVERAGRYRVSLRRWPEELTVQMDAKASAEFMKDCVYPGMEAVSLKLTRARLRLFEQDHCAGIAQDSEAAVFELDLPAGRTQMEAWMKDESGEERAAYYVTLERVAE